MSLPPYRLFRVNTERVELVTPHMKRITIDGSCLPAFRAGLPAQWLKVFVPSDEQNVPGRAYMVRRFDPVSKKLDLDFVLHADNGPVSAWAARVKPGESFEISAAHPRSGFALPSAMERCLLFGDDTALPAIAGILEALPAHTPADVFFGSRRCQRRTDYRDCRCGKSNLAAPQAGRASCCPRAGGSRESD
jgi:NADPH-dependent ferric siderophore reductase